MKKQEQFREAFQKIYVSQELERKILDMTVNRKEKRKMTKLIYASLALVFMGIISISVVYADNIKNVVTSWFSNMTFENGSTVEITNSNHGKRIPESAPKTDSLTSLTITYEELEKTLGFPVLKTEKIETNQIRYTSDQNKDGSIGRIGLDVSSGDYNQRFLDLSAVILSENASSGFVAAVEEGVDATGGKEFVENYTIENLGIDTVIYGFDWDSKRFTAAFAYDDIFYLLTVRGVSVEEMKEVLNSLQY